MEHNCSADLGLFINCAPLRSLMTSFLQIDVMFAEVDEIDIMSTSLAFVIGRRSEPAQPQLPRFRAAAKKAKKFVALLEDEKQVPVASSVHRSRVATVLIGHNNCIRPFFGTCGTLCGHNAKL
jgi:hypothetical protein